MNRSPSLELSQVYSGMKATGDPNTGSIGDGSRRQAVGTDSGEDGRISTGAIVLAGSDVLLPPSQASSTKQLIESKHGTNTDPKKSPTQTSASLAVSPAMEEKPLPQDYKPSEFTVIVGRGKKIRESIGNVHLRTLAMTYLQQYAGAMKNRQAKTDVVNNILSIIRAVCPNGGAFVRCDKGQWYEVSDRVAREKVGYVFRDLLSDSYESSCKSKTAKRKRQQQLQETHHQVEMDGPDDFRLIQWRLAAQFDERSQGLTAGVRFSSSGTTRYVSGEQPKQVQRSLSDSEFGKIGSNHSHQFSAMPLASSVSFADMSARSSLLQQQQEASMSRLRSSQDQAQAQHLRYQRQLPLGDHFGVFAPAMSHQGMGTAADAPFSGANFDSLNAFSRRRSSRDYSDYSEAFIASELDDSNQNPDSVRSTRSAPGALAGGWLGHVNQQPMNDLLTSPLLDCHIEGPNERDSSGSD